MKKGNPLLRSLKSKSLKNDAVNLNLSNNNTSTNNLIVVNNKITVNTTIKATTALYKPKTTQEIKTKSDISDARANGANFLVSFGAFTDLVNVNEEIPVIPGALTPTEFLQLHRSGINLAKLYPASSFGAKYLKDLQVLLPEMNFIVTGGIGTSKAELETWLSAGAVAIGIGSNLGNPLKDATAFQKKVAELVTALS